MSTFSLFEVDFESIEGKVRRKHDQKYLDRIIDEFVGMPAKSAAIPGDEKGAFESKKDVESFVSALRHRIKRRGVENLGVICSNGNAYIYKERN